MDPDLRAKRAAAGRKGGQATAARRRAVPHGTPVVAAGAPIGPDDIVFGNAKQLREMAAALQQGDQRTSSRAATAAAGRVAAYQKRRPDADLTQLVGRPICETPPGAVPGRPGPVDRAPLRTQLDTAGAAELWIDDYLEAPNWWGDGISARDVREALDTIGSRDIVVHMNSGGGDYFEGVAIYQAIKQHPGATYIAIDALAASAASVVAMAGDTIGIGDGAFIMIHQASSFAYGNAEDLLTIANMLDEVDGQIAGFYVRRSGKSLNEMRELMAAETWMGPDTAIGMGMADEMLNPPATDPNAVDTGSGEVDPEVAALFAFLTPVASTAAPAPGPAPDPAVSDPADADWSSLFRDDLEDMFT